MDKNMEIERKFIVINNNHNALKEVAIYQGYIEITDKFEKRIRQINDNGIVTYIKTEKHDTDDPMVRIEKEVEITKEEFMNLKSMVIKELSKVRKFYKTEKCQEYTIDYYDNGLELLEIELSCSDEQFDIPKEVTILREVTSLKEYKNQNLALCVNKKDQNQFLVAKINHTKEEI